MCHLARGVAWMVPDEDFGRQQGDRAWRNQSADWYKIGSLVIARRMTSVVRFLSLDYEDPTRAQNQQTEVLF